MTNTERTRKLIEKKVGAIYQNTTPAPQFTMLDDAATYLPPVQPECWNCKGKGYVVDEQGEIECPECEGSGVI